jgi:hypothetical protein
MSKITKEELEKLQDQESKKGQFYTEIGRIESVKQQYLTALQEVLVEQQKTKTLLEDKYGKINVDLKDGSYTQVEDGQ